MTLPQSTTTLTKSADKVITEKTTLPALTSTAYKTTVMSLEDTISTIPHIPTTKTTIVKSTATVFTTSTKTSKGEQLAQPKTYVWRLLIQHLLRNAAVLRSSSGIDHLFWYLFFQSNSSMMRNMILILLDRSLPGCFSLKKRVEWRSMANPLH